MYNDRYAYKLDFTDRYGRTPWLSRASAPNNIFPTPYEGDMIMTIRFATEQDIPRMIDLLHQVGEVHHQIRPDLFRSGAQKYDEAALKMLLADEKRPIIAGAVDGKMVGYAFCILQETKDDPVLCDRKTLYIDDLCVDKDVRGGGVAQAIYQGVLDYAREIHCDAVTLNVWCGNDRAMHFYEKCGLKPQKIGMELIL